MTVGPEFKIERQVVRDAEDDGWKQYKIAFLGTRAAPDRWFGKEGRAVLIEFKRPGVEPTRQQTKRHKELREHFGFEVYACDNVEDAYRILGIRK